jgi:hypothetical protein
LTAAGFLSEQKLPGFKNQRYLLIWETINVKYKDHVDTIYWSCLTRKILLIHNEIFFLVTFLAAIVLYPENFTSGTHDVQEKVVPTTRANTNLIQYWYILCCYYQIKRIKDIFVLEKNIFIVLFCHLINPDAYGNE